METTIIQRYIHTSPRKLRLVADMVRKMEPEKALETLKFTQKYAANDLLKAIQVALASGKQKGMESLNFKALEINEGPRLKRMRAGSRGHGNPYKRRMSHIKIVLTDDLKLKPQNSNAKTKKQMKGGRQKEVVVDNSAEKAE